MLIDLCLTIVNFVKLSATCCPTFLKGFKVKQSKILVTFSAFVLIKFKNLIKILYIKYHNMLQIINN